MADKWNDIICYLALCLTSSCFGSAGLYNRSDTAFSHWSTLLVQTQESTPVTLCTAKTQTAGRSMIKLSKSLSSFQVQWINFSDAHTCTYKVHRRVLYFTTGLHSHIILSSNCHIFSLYQSDPHELFVPSSDYYEVIQLRTNWPTVLPCQVTSPEAKVTLHREFPPVEVAVDGTEISFNVKKGFTIHRPRPYHAGALYCVASLGNLRQSSTKYMLIYVNCECCHWWSYLNHK